MTNNFKQGNTSGLILPVIFELEARKSKNKNLQNSLTIVTLHGEVENARY